MMTAILTFLILFLASAHAKTALLVIDVQDCFVEGGTLAVNGGKSIANKINQIIEEKGCLFDMVVKSQDFHPKGHISFASTHGVKPFTAVDLMCLPSEDSSHIDAATCCLVDFTQPTGATCKNNPTCGSKNRACEACGGSKPNPKCLKMTQSVWPDHCVQGADGDAALLSTVKKVKGEIITQKGDNQFVDAYSAFFDNSKSFETDLVKIFDDAGITSVYVVGIATDFCVHWSAVDAKRLGYKTYVVQDATANIFDATTKAALADMRDKKIDIIQTADVLATKCPVGPTYEWKVAYGSCPTGYWASGCGQSETKLKGTLQCMGARDGNSWVAKDSFCTGDKPVVKDRVCPATGPCPRCKGCKRDGGCFKACGGKAGYCSNCDSHDGRRKGACCRSDSASDPVECKLAQHQFSNDEVHACALLPADQHVNSLLKSIEKRLGNLRADVNALKK